MLANTRHQAAMLEPTQDAGVLTMNVVGRRRDLNCSACGYGIAAHARPPGRCPMCGGDSTSWIPRPATGRTAPSTALIRPPAAKAP